LSLGRPAIPQRQSLPRCQRHAPVSGVTLVDKPGPKEPPCSRPPEAREPSARAQRGFRTITILVKYGLERVLFRLSRFRRRDVFILKGGLLFELRTEQRYRPTPDADFLARGGNAPERFAHIFRELCVLEVDEDGLRFDVKTVEAERISADADYEGVWVTLLVRISNAQRFKEREALEKVNRQANERPLDSGTATIQ
jgi:hypothetical protein